MVIGITGLPCSGKSELSRIFASFGAAVIDVDKLGHEALRLDNVKARLNTVFGNAIFDELGEVDRKQLGHLVFSDPASLTKLESIVHPVMVEMVRERISTSSTQTVIVDAAILFQMGLDKLCDEVIVVIAPEEMRIALAAKKGWSEENLKMRESHFSENIKMMENGGTITVNNNGTVDQLKETATSIWKEVNNDR
ncbi:MAG: dephospho-CoA kinase [Planctomycetes bacterium]|nr:dephospho-CoA kinase [Planctomycetota bacterium]